MGHYRFYEIDPYDNITVGYSVECRSDTDALRAHTFGTGSGGRSLEEQQPRRPPERRGPAALGPVAGRLDFVLLDGAVLLLPTYRLTEIAGLGSASAGRRLGRRNRNIAC